jgi:putative membrane protein
VSRLNVALTAFLWSMAVDAHVGAPVVPHANEAASTGRSDASGSFVQLLTGSVATSDLVATICIATAIVVSLVLYGIGVARLWRSTAIGRGISVRNVVAFAMGCLVLAMALLGPLDQWAARSFAAHMGQHETLMLVAAPLLVAGRPLAAWTWMLVPAAKRTVNNIVRAPRWLSVWQALTGLGFSTALQLVVLLLWHVPRFFDAAATHAGVHALQHSSFLASALCFWWATRLGPARRSERSDTASALAIACLFITMLVTGALGALLTFATIPWYSTYAVLQVSYASSALEDQQLGGLLMWVPGGVVYMACALLHAARLLRRTAPPRVGQASAMRAENAMTSCLSVAPVHASARSVGATNP